MIRSFRRLALLVEYDGAFFAGSQLQTNGPSIQGELERAVETMTGSFARVAFAGRTDAGVHALGQVACFDTPAAYSCESFVGGLNVRLPNTIALRSARDVDPAFDPRRDAVGRLYRYSILRSAARSPLTRAHAWQVAASLDVQKMREAAGLLIGERDFAAFASIEASRAGTRRNLRSVEFRCSGRMVEIEFEANAFLMHQVRRTVAALVDVGSGRIPVREFERHLREAQPGSYERAAPPQGLCLLSVIYEPPLFPDQRELD